MNSPDGKVMHAALSLGGSPVYLVDEYLDYGGKSLELLGGSPVTIHLLVPDCDAVFNSASRRAAPSGCRLRTSSGATATEGSSTPIGTTGLLRPLRRR